MFAGWSIVGAALGAAGGALIGAIGGASLLGGVIAGSAVGALAGVGTAVVDAISGHAISSHLGPLGRAVREPHSALFVLRNALTAPWLYSTAAAVEKQAIAAQVKIFHRPDALDDAADAFRHSYANAAFTLRIVRERGWSIERAADLVEQAGIAHERDGTDNISGSLSREMDLRNNATGREIAAELLLEQNTSPRALEQRLLQALDTGRLLVIDQGQLRPSTPADRRSAVVKP